MRDAEVIDIVRERLRKIVASVLEVEKEDIESGALFYEELGISSLEKVAIAAAIEREFGALSAEDAAALTSLNAAACVLSERATSLRGVDLIDRLVAGHVAAGRGERASYLDPQAGGGEISYADLLEAARGYAGALRAAGVPVGARGLLVTDDSVAAVVAVLGLWWHGCAPVVISPVLTDDEVRYIAADCAAAMVHLDAAPKRQRALEKLFATTTQFTGADVRAALATAEPGPARCPQAAGPSAAWSAGHEALVQYTSGSTGMPKGVRHSAGAIAAMADGIGTVLALTPEDTVLSSARMSFGYGFGSSVLCPLAAGSRVALISSTVDVHSLAAAMQRHRPTVLFSVPRLYAALLNDSGTTLASECVDSVRLCVAAGENLPGPLSERIRTAFQAELLNGLGATEVLYIVVGTPPGKERPGTFGVPVRGITATVRAADGTPVADREEGRLHIIGPTVALGYIGRPEAAAVTFADGGAYTGDVVRRTPDGAFTHLCRVDDVLNLGGYKVVPSEIEGVLRDVEGVQDCVVVGGRDTDGLEQAVAYLVARPGSDLAVVRRAVLAAIRGGLAAYKRPARLEFLDELPTTSTGKLAAFELRKAATQP